MFYRSQNQFKQKQDITEKQMAFSAVETSLVQPGEGQECRSKCSLSVEATMARSEPSLSVPSTASLLL